MYTLSVIIPTYNSDKTLERCLNSLISQTYKDFQICIIDGDSSDQTIAIASDFRYHFSNIIIVSEKDSGTYDAMNKGINIAQGDWLYFLGSDDEIFDENVFADIFKNTYEKTNEIIYGNVIINGDTVWAKDGEIYNGQFDIDRLLTRNICHQSIFYRKRLFKKLGNYNLRYPICADWELNLRFFSVTESKYLDRIIAKFYGGGISSQPVIDPIGKDLTLLRKKTLLKYNLYKFMSSLHLHHFFSFKIN
jgi:glycosyltransferase involved in cell wall biosynthesis